MIKVSMPLLAGFLALSLTACGTAGLPAAVSPLLMQSGSLQIEGLDAPLGQDLAQFALSQNSGGTGYCYQYVAQAIHAHLPAFLTGNHAYLAADQLALSPHFKELGIAPEQLPFLPAGAVVVWGQGSSVSGHISIADGRGNEVSDHIEPQMRAHYGGGLPRVFVPVPFDSAQGT